MIGTMAGTSKMGCGHVRKRLADLAAGELDGKETGAVESHLAACEACRRSLEEISGTLGLLHRLGDEELPADFQASLHRRLVAAGPPPRPGRWSGLTLSWRPLVWAGAGALATLFAVGAVKLHPWHRGAGSSTVADGPVTPTFHVPATKLAVIKIDFVAQEPIEDVAFAITLPEGLHFVSGGRELPDREIRWQGRLDQGSNLIPVAVRGRRAGLYTVAARATGRGVSATHEVVLEVIKG